MNKYTIQYNISNNIILFLTHGCDTWLCTTKLHNDIYII